jgi:hypothetical protein
VQLVETEEFGYLDCWRPPPDFGRDVLVWSERYLESWAASVADALQFDDTHAMGPSEPMKVIRACCAGCCDFKKDEWLFKVTYNYTIIAFSFGAWPGAGQAGRAAFTVGKENFGADLDCADGEDKAKARRCKAAKGVFDHFVFPGGPLNPALVPIDPFPNPALRTTSKLSATETAVAHHIAGKPTYTVSLTSSGYAPIP